MRLRLDGESGAPYYQQVAQQVKRLIVTGALAAGDRLPTVRDLAADLTVNPNTVARAYQDLEREGFVETRRGLGTFACAPAAMMSLEERRAQFSRLLDQALLEGRHLGLSEQEMDNLIQERRKEMYEQSISR